MEYEKGNEVKALIQSGLKHTSIGFDIADGKCKICGELIERVRIDLPGPCHDYIPIVGHRNQDLCPGPWCHNKELMEHQGMMEYYKPLPCFDPACNRVWEETKQ